MSSKKIKVFESNVGEFTWNLNSPLSDILGYCDLGTLVKMMKISKDFLGCILKEIVDFRDFKNES